MSALTAHLLRLLRQVRTDLGLGEIGPAAELRFADALDSMGLVEFLGRLADDCGVGLEAVETAAGRCFTTVGDLAQALDSAGIRPWRAAPQDETSAPAAAAVGPCFWLLGCEAVLPAATQTSAELDALLGQPAGWLERHAGIRSRRLWRDEDPLDAAARAGNACLERAGLTTADVGALLVTATAPPLAVGLGAALHQRLGLGRATVLEIGGGCTGFLACLWTARRLLPDATVLILTVEAPSRWLAVRPGPAGETAALFGDAAAAVLIRSAPQGAASLPSRRSFSAATAKLDRCCTSGRPRSAASSWTWTVRSWRGGRCGRWPRRCAACAGDTESVHGRPRDWWFTAATAASRG
jgi:hypothetical protein